MLASQCHYDQEGESECHTSVLPRSTVCKVRGLSQIIFPTVTVIMTLRGGGGLRV